LNGVITETEERIVSFVVAALADKPTRRLGAKIDLEHDDKSGNAGLSKNKVSMNQS
jgi:hypothetical protein